MLLLLGNGFPEGAGTSLQQSLGKYLQGYLLARGWQLVRTHRLFALLGEATAHDARLAAYDVLCQRVTNSYVADRYPGSSGSLPSEARVQADVREALSLIALLFPDETLPSP